MMSETNAYGPLSPLLTLTCYTVRRKIKRFLMCKQGGREMVIQSYLPGKREKTGMEFSPPPPLPQHGPAAPLVQYNVTRPVSSSANITG